MLDMQLPWWEFVVRAAVVYAALLVMVRVGGKRTVGQFTPFDLVLVMLLSESVSNALGGGDLSLTGGLTGAATLMALDVLVSFATARSRRLDAMVQGVAVLVGRDGVIYREVLARERVPQSDVERALRAADCPLHEMHMAVLEADGNISILRRQARAAAQDAG